MPLSGRQSRFRWLAAGLALSVAALSGGSPAHAVECPADAVEISRWETAGRVHVECQCTGSRIYFLDACRDPADPQIFERLNAWLDTLEPIDDTEYEAATGLLFTFGPTIRAKVRALGLPELRVSEIALATLAAARGHYRRAREYLTDVAHDATVSITTELRSLVDELAGLQAARERAGPLAAEALDPAEVKQASWRTRQYLTLASYALGMGDYDYAHNLYMKALLNAGEARRVELIPKIGDAMVWTRQLAAARAEREGRGLPTAVYREGRERAQASAAWSLGLHLVQARQPAAARSYLEQAAVAYRRLDATMAEDIERLLAEIAEAGDEPERVARTSPKPDGSPRTVLSSASRASIILDALDYGKGDWDASLAFLSVAAEADPSNRNVAEAYQYVAGLAAAN